MRGFTHALLGFLLLLPVFATAQSSLPPCPSTGVKHNCWGTATLLDGTKFVGEFRDGKRNGQGTYTFPFSGGTYVGGFRDSLYHGQGTFTRPDGSKYVGDYKYGNRDGQGTYTFPDGAKYVGEFRDDKRDGQGTYTWPNGHKYVGEWKDGKRNGQGTYTLPDGAKYVGEFRDDKSHGQGIEYRADGSVNRSGLWDAGSLKSSYALDTNRFPFNPSTTVAQPQPDSAQLERQRLLVEVEAERQKRLQAEQRLAERDQRAAPPVRQEAAIRSAHALVIGNGTYAGSARLDNPVNDATAVSDKLRSMGFTVTTVTNAPRARMLQALSQFQRSAASSDVSLLYFAGHGVQIDGANFILPTDIDHSDVGKAMFDGVRLSDAIDNFLPGKTKLVLLDACRDNPLQRMAGRSLTRGLAPMNVAQGTLIAYATRDGQVALDGVGERHSPFTKALLEHLADPSDISVVLRRVREKVMQATAGKQQPWDYGSLTGGELVLSQIQGR